MMAGMSSMMSAMMGKGMMMGCGKGPMSPMMMGKGPMSPMMAAMGGKGNLTFIPGRGWVPVAGTPVVGGGMGMMQSGDKRRSWSPHAGSRAIRECLKGGGDPAALGLQPGKGARPPSASKSRTRSRSRRSSSEVSSESSERDKKKKKKKKKSKGKKNKKGKKRSKSGSSVASVSSTSSSRSRSHSKRKRKSDEGEKEDGEVKESKEVEEAKMEALKVLTKLQGEASKEQRAKDYRLLLRKWHPDKNPDRVEVATAVFQFLQKGKALLNLAG